MRNEKSLLIIGPLPENHGIGGVTIHTQRLLDFLDNNGFDYEILDYGRESILRLLAKIRSTSAVHFHVSNPVFLFFLVMISKIMGKYVIMTLHGNYGRFSLVKNYLVRLTVKYATIPIIINRQSYDRCKNFNNRTVLIPAFIPPQKAEALQPEIISLVNKYREEGRKIVSTTA